MFGVSWIEVIPEQRGSLIIHQLRDRFVICDSKALALKFIAEHPYMPNIRLWESIPVQVAVIVNEIEKRGAETGESMVSKSDEPAAQ